MWLNLIKGDDILYTVDIKGINTYTFSNLAFGTDYKYSIELNSEYVKTEKNSLTSGNVSILINPEEAIVHSGNPIINQITEEKSYVTWNWELYHTSCDDVYFYYKDLTGKTEKFHHVKLQSRFQPSVFDNKTSDNKRNVITYGFKMKSSSLNKKGYTADSDGYITIHQKTIKL